MKRHKQLYLCATCKRIVEVRRRLTDRVPRCCGEVMKKIGREQPPGRVK